MTDLYNGQITDLLNNACRYDPEVIAFSYAILQEKRRIMQELDQTRTMSVIDDLPESILDVLAVELRTPYYVDSLNVDAKREIIKKSFLWAARAGTVSAVEELVQTLFGENGEINEWFEYGGVPGRWKLKIDLSHNPELLHQSTEKFYRILRYVGRCSAHLEQIIYVYMCKNPTTAYVAATPCGMAASYTVRLPGTIRLKDIHARAHVSGGLAHMHETITIKIGGTL